MAAATAGTPSSADPPAAASASEPETIGAAKITVSVASAELNGQTVGAAGSPRGTGSPRRSSLWDKINLSEMHALHDEEDSLEQQLKELDEHYYRKKLKAYRSSPGMKTAKPRQDPRVRAVQSFQAMGAARRQQAAGASGAPTWEQQLRQTSPGTPLRARPDGGTSAPSPTFRRSPYGGVHLPSHIVNQTTSILMTICVALCFFATAGIAAESYDPSSAEISRNGQPTFHVGRHEILDPPGAVGRTTVFFPSDPIEWRLPDPIELAGGLVSTPSRSFLDAPLYLPPAGKFYPVVSFLPANGTSHLLSYPLLEHIAARGFVVLASDADGGNSSTSCPPDFGGLAASDFARALLAAGTMPAEGFSSALSEATGAVQHYALIGHGSGGIASIGAGSRDGEVRLNGAVMVTAADRASQCAATADIASAAYENFLQVLAPSINYTQAQASATENVSAAEDGFAWTVTLPGITDLGPISGGGCSVVWQAHAAEAVLSESVSASLEQLCGAGTEADTASAQERATRLAVPVTAALVRAFGGDAEAEGCAGLTMRVEAEDVRKTLPGDGGFLADAGATAILVPSPSPSDESVAGREDEDTSCLFTGMPDIRTGVEDTDSTSEAVQHGEIGLAAVVVAIRILQLYEFV